MTLSHPDYGTIEDIRASLHTDGHSPKFREVGEEEIEALQREWDHQHHDSVFSNF